MATRAANLLLPGPARTRPDARAFCAAGLWLQWRAFGPGYHHDRPRPGGPLQHYDRCMPLQWPPASAANVLAQGFGKDAAQVRSL